MDENISQGSADSEDYVLINGEPRLRITGNMSDITDEIVSHSQPVTTSESDETTTEQTAQDSSSSTSSNVMRLSIIEDLGQPDNCTMFDGVTYLGSVTVNAPRSEAEIYRNMCVLNDQSQMVIPITLCVPNNCDGIVRMLDPGTGTDIAQYKVSCIMFCARGPTESREKHVFAFTCSHGTSMENVFFQCHVFRCNLIEAVSRILYCFATTFRRPVKQPRSPVGSSQGFELHMFSVSMEIREDDGRGNFSTCPRDKSVHKIRRNVEKKIVVTIQETQLSLTELKIERCFGLLLSPGRNVKNSDMQLLEMDSMGQNADSKGYHISGHWDPTEPTFAVLNSETEKETRVFFTVAIDLVMYGIQEPVRFAIEAKAKVYPQTERFWYFTKRPQVESFHVQLKQIECEAEAKFEVVSVCTQTDIDRSKTRFNLSLTNKMTPQYPSTTPDTADDPDSDGDEPLLSGSGVVSKEVTDDNVVEAWRDVLNKWHQQLDTRPPQVTKLVRRGIPEALRGEVWPLLAGCAENNELLEAYRVLIAKESSNEQVIQRDIYRTFPAHDFFRESGGAGQDSLYKISKAYSVYDEEIGYCQGLSFLAASLLLHMPEEQAFCVLVKIMFDYELRELFKQDFEQLHIKFYQLERLMQDQLPDLFEHLLELNVEVHMFASQWFLTLFTAKFPLHVVYLVLDLFLSEGKNIIFCMAMAFLKNSKKDLLALDFEGVLKYFRVHLPKKYRSEDSSQDLLNTAVTTKVSTKKLKKYEKEYLVIKEQEIDPVERLENEQKRLMEDVMRLEQENDNLAHELITTKLSLNKKITSLESNCDSSTKELTQLKSSLKESEEEKKRLAHESQQVKEMCRRELERVESDNTHNVAIINDYKKICTQLSERLERQSSASKDELARLQSSIQSCESCSTLFDSHGQIKLPTTAIDQSKMGPHVLEQDRQIRELELELAQTKLALVEAQCKTQDLTHYINSTMSDLNSSKNSWFQKTLSQLKEVTSTRKEGKVISADPASQ